MANDSSHDLLGPIPSFEDIRARARFYFLPLDTTCLSECQFCADLGCRNHYDRNWGDFERAVKRAVSGESNAVLFPPHVLWHPLRDQMLDHCCKNGLRPIVQIQPWLIQETFADELRTWRDRGFGVNFLLSSGQDFSFVEGFFRPDSWTYCTWVAKAREDLAASIAALSPVLRERLHLYFPFRQRWGDRNMTASQVQHRLKQLSEKIPEFVIRPPLGIEIWNNQIDPNLCLEPIERIASSSRSARPQIQLSVVIPAYNNSAYLQHTLRHLQRQKLAADFFEIIVVDDGSKDNSYVDVLKFIRDHDGRLNCKYIYFPRHQPRRMGDRNFRAGIARNLGVKNAVGGILCFLDSDIVTPPNFLIDLLEKHQSYDVVQCTRLNLSEEASGPGVQFEAISRERDTFFTDGRYWETFYEARDWSALPFFWKYTCTYGLSMKKDVFKSIGWLRRTFIYYGFEDTELGYRLAKAGHSFHLNKMTVYHLFHGNHRSEYANQDWQRHLLLTRTARIFYQQALDTEIFEHFRSYLQDSFAYFTNQLDKVFGAVRAFRSRSQAEPYG